MLFIIETGFPWERELRFLTMSSKQFASIRDVSLFRCDCNDFKMKSRYDIKGGDDKEGNTEKKEEKSFSACFLLSKEREEMNIEICLRI